MAKYHNITKQDMLNGDGLRVVLWLSGCSHKCPGCQNPITWNENKGLDFDKNALQEIFDELNNDWCSGITLSGGDPLFLGNRQFVRSLIKDYIKPKFPNKTIWIYTGYTWEELQNKYNLMMDEILPLIDVLIDGKFEINKISPNKPWVGSSNQRVIDVQKSLKENKIILYE